MRVTINDTCGPDDPGQDYADCRNCGCGRIYELECDFCGWHEGQPLSDWSHPIRRKEQSK